MSRSSTYPKTCPALAACQSCCPLKEARVTIYSITILLSRSGDKPTSQEGAGRACSKHQLWPRGRADDSRCTPHRGNPGCEALSADAAPQSCRHDCYRSERIATGRWPPQAVTAAPVQAVTVMHSCTQSMQHRKCQSSDTGNRLLSRSISWWLSCAEGP